MAVKVTRGLELLLYVGENVIGGQKDASISMEADSIDISNKNDFGWSSTIGGAKSWSVSTNALFITDDVLQKALLDAFVAGRNLRIELKNTDLKISNKTIAFFVIVLAGTDLFNVFLAQYCNKRIMRFNL